MKTLEASDHLSKSNFKEKLISIVTNRWAISIITALLLCPISPLLAQHLTLFDINAESYPQMKAKFFAFDEHGVQLTSLTRSDVVIMENQFAQKVIKVTNPEYEKPKPISVVLTVDVSGSMAGRNIEIAKEATRMLVRQIQLDQSECAITSFDQSSYINADFSSDPNRLNDAIEGLEALGATNYREAFNNHLTGALEIANSGLHKKAVIFLTDGLGTVDPIQIIKLANSLGITIYCVTLDMSAPDILKEISTKTGGSYFENITTKEAATNAYKRILSELLELEPSTVEWHSTPGCQFFKAVSFQVPEFKLADNSFYRVNEKLGGKLKASPDNLRLNLVAPGNVSDTTITLTATNLDFNILSATSSNSNFKVMGTDFPFKLASGQSTPITIQYKAEVRGYESAKIGLVNDRCEPTIIHVSNGFSGEEKVQLKVEHPNGGEVFFVGTDTLINWSGVFPSEKVKLELSSDSARSWKTISEDAQSLQNEWHVPDIVGDKMLIRASINFDSKKSGLRLLYERPIERFEAGTAYEMSPDNSKLLYRRLSHIYILDLVTGETLDSIRAPYMRSFFGNNGSIIYGWPNSPLPAYSATDYKPMGQAPTIENESFVSFNDDRTQYLRQNQNEIQIVEIATGNILKAMSLPHNGMASKFRDNLIAVVRGRDRVCEVWDIDSETMIASFTTDVTDMRSGFITSNKKHLVTKAKEKGYSRHQFKMAVYDIEMKKEVRSWITPQEQVEMRDFAGNLMLHTVNNIPEIVDIATGDVIAVVPGSSIEGSLSRDGKYVMMYSHNIGMKMFRLELGSDVGCKGSDTSDHTFSIVAPKLVANSYDFGLVRLGDSKEDVVALFLNNFNPVDVIVDSIYLEGGDVDAFSIVSNHSALKINRLSTQDIELRFNPSKIGLHETSIVIQTHFEKIVVSLKGVGVERKIAILDRTINLGKVMVGSAKDSLVTAVITNIGNSTLSITSLTVAGPDRDQFELLSYDGFKLEKNKSSDIHIVFRPNTKGKTSTRIIYIVEGEIGVNELQVFAEGVASLPLGQDDPSDSLRKFNARILNASTRAPIPSKLTWSDSTHQNDKGQFVFYTTFDSQLKMVAEADGYLAESFVLRADAERKERNVYHNFLLTRIILGETVRLDNVLFVQSKSELLFESYGQLEMLHRYLINNPDCKIELSGHTDNQGNSRANKILSENRVITISDYLIGRGINKRRIIGKGYGDTKPVASNAQEETRRLNRRVEFRIIE